MKRERVFPVLVIGTCLAVALPFAWGAAPRERPDDERPARRSSTVEGSVKIAETLICHNPNYLHSRSRSYPREMYVSQAAVSAHLEHGDRLGACHTPCLDAASQMAVPVSTDSEVFEPCVPETGSSDRKR